MGAIAASAPDVSAFVEMLEVDKAAVKEVLTSWDPVSSMLSSISTARHSGPMESRRPLNPPAFGLAGVNNHTWTGGWGSVTYWNAYVGNLEMHGNFYDPRLDDAEKYPVAARTKQGHKQDTDDLITPKLPALHFYQLLLPTPKPPAGSFDEAMARNGEEIFNRKARCGSCHVPPLFTEPGWNTHTAEEIGIDDFQARRSPDGAYNTTPFASALEFREDSQGRVLP